MNIRKTLALAVFMTMPAFITAAPVSSDNSPTAAAARVLQLTGRIDF